MEGETALNNSGNRKIAAHRKPEIVLPDWLINTGPFEDPCQGEAQGTAMVVEQDGRTTLTIKLLQESGEIGDGTLKHPSRFGSAPRPAQVLALTLALADAQAVA